MDLTEYYELICRQPLLTKEEEDELLEIVKINPDQYSEKQIERARNKLLESNLRFVFKKAKGLAKGDPNQFEELIAAGNEGLIVGLDKFDPGKGVRFLSYAGWWVLQRQLKEMSQMRLVSLPVWKQQLSTRIMKVQDTEDHPLTLEELKERFPDVKEKDLRELSSTRYLTFYFEDMQSDNDNNDTPEDNTMSASLLDNEYEDVIDDVIQLDDAHRLLVNLNEVHADIIRMLYGIGTGQELSTSNIAEQLGMTREEVRRHKRDALARLRQEVFHQQTTT